MVRKPRDTADEPKSWGEAIQGYRKEKQLLAWEIPRVTKDFASSNEAFSSTVSTHLEPEPQATTDHQRKTRHPSYGDEGLVHRTRYTQARREAAYNPITGRHIDTKVETRLTAKEKSDMVNKANKGQDRALATETPFNVINFANKREGLDPVVQEKEVVKTYIPDSRAPYNIVSNFSHKDHHWAIPELRPSEPRADPKTRYASKFIGRQEYNIVNNRYLDNNDARMADEAEAAKARATDAFWKTHNYDPIEAKYYDDQKEEKHWQTVRVSEQTQGRAQAENIRMNAPTTHLAEGQLYDPISCVAKNEDAIKQLHRLEQGKVLNTQAKLERVGDYLASEDDMQDMKEARALNRTHWKRFEDQHSHGYDIVNNAPHFGRGAVHTHLPKARPPPSLWESINEEALKSIDSQTLTEPPATQAPRASEQASGSVPPIRITPFHQSGSQASSIRSSVASSAKSKPGSRAPSVQSTGRSVRSVSSSGRVRTGGFQHLNSTRED